MDQSIAMVTDSRSEAEMESREQSARTHNQAWSLANQRYEQIIHAGAINLRAAPSVWPARVGEVETYIMLWTDNYTALQESNISR